jgi:hypothetical protein
MRGEITQRAVPIQQRRPLFPSPTYAQELHADTSMNTTAPMLQDEYRALHVSCRAPPTCGTLIHSKGAC